MRDRHFGSLRDMALSRETSDLLFHEPIPFLGYLCLYPIHDSDLFLFHVSSGPDVLVFVSAI